MKSKSFVREAQILHQLNIIRKAVNNLIDLEDGVYFEKSFRKRVQSIMDEVNSIEDGWISKDISDCIKTHEKNKNVLDKFFNAIK